MLLIDGSKVLVLTGDLFKQSGLKAIAFNEYFDTQVDDRIISKSSLNGMYIETYSGRTVEELNQIINEYSSFRCSNFRTQYTNHSCSNLKKRCLTGKEMKGIVIFLHLLILMFTSAHVHASLIESSVKINGNDWAQPKLFTNTSWITLDELCPVSSDRACTGLINGYNVSGWRWANSLEVARMYVATGIPPDNVLTELTNTQEKYDKSNWAPNFHSLFDLTVDNEQVRSVIGWTSSEASESNGLNAFVFDALTFREVVDIAAVNNPQTKTKTFDIRGAWLYRDNELQVHVNESRGLYLFSLGLLVLISKKLFG